MDKLAVELQDGYFVEIDSLNHTLRQRYAGTGVPEMHIVL